MCEYLQALFSLFLLSLDNEVHIPVKKIKWYKYNTNII